MSTLSLQRLGGRTLRAFNSSQNPIVSKVTLRKKQGGTNNFYIRRKSVISEKTLQISRCRAFKINAVQAKTTDAEIESSSMKLNLWRRFSNFVCDPHARVCLPDSVETDTGKMPISTAIYGALGAFVAFMCLGTLNIYFSDVFSLPFMIGSFGTVSILFFGNPDAAVLNPWNIVMGHMLGAFSVMLWIHMPFAINAVVLRALSMATLVGSMLVFGAVHPPGGAMVIACVDSAQMQALGWYYLLFPGLLGIAVLYPIARFTTMMKRKYPFDFKFSKKTSEDLKLKPKIA